MLPLPTCRLLAGAALLLSPVLSAPSLAQTTPPAWARAARFGPRDIYSALPRAVVDAAGNTYELAGFLSTVQVGASPLTTQGGTDVFLAKYTPTGALAWVRQLGSSDDDQSSGLALDAAGNVYVAGTFSGSNLALGNGLTLTGNGSSRQKLFVVRYSPQGTAEWARQSDANGYAAVVGGGLGVDAAGTVYVAGLGTGPVTLGGNTLPGISPVAFVARLAGSTGAVLGLTKSFDYYPNSGWLKSPGLAVAPNGSYYLLTTFDYTVNFGTTALTSRGQVDVLMARYSATGTVEWARQLGGSAVDAYNCARTDAAGNLYVAGHYGGPATLETTSLPFSGRTDGYVLRYSPQGTLQWLRTLNGPDAEALVGVVADAAGNAYVTGNFGATAQLGGTSLSSVGSNDLLVASVDGQGQLRWVQQASGPANYSEDLGLDGANNVHVLGKFFQSCQFGAVSLTSTAPLSETFVAQLGNAPLPTRPASAAQPLALYPNPAHDQLYLPALPTGTPVQLLDAWGRVARETRVVGGQVSVGGLTPGLYHLRAPATPGQPGTGRVLVR